MGFFEILKELVNSTKEDILYNFTRMRNRDYISEVFANPYRFAKPIEIDKIIADTKVSRDGVEFYKKKILSGEKIDPIIVVRHPRMDIYAVLDGHHRYYAYRELGKETINCAVAGDYSSVNFYLTEYGFFQPSAEATKRFREPVKQLHANLKQFLEEAFNEENLKKEIEKRKAA